MERTDTSISNQVFEGIGNHKAALETILVGCMLDEACLKRLEGKLH